MTHTPGPWTTKRGEGFPGDIGIIADGGLIAEVYKHGGGDFLVLSPVEAIVLLARYERGYTARYKPP